MDSRLADAQLGESLRSLVAQTPIAVALFDSDFRYLHVNDAYAAVTRQPSASHRGRQIQEILPAASTAGIALEKARGGEPTEFWISMADGAESEDDQRHWVGVAFPLRTPDGRLLVGTMMRDLTARTRVERERQAALGHEQLSRLEAERQRDFLRLVLENAPMGISVCEGPNHRLMLISDFSLRILGMPRESLVGKSLVETLPGTFDVVRDVYDRVYAEGQPVVVPERLIPLPDGRRVWMYACYAPILGADGSPIGVMSLALDMTSMKRAQQVLESQKHVLELMAQGRSLPTVLDAIVRVVTAHSPGGALPSILLVSEDGRVLHHGAAADLPAGFTTAIDGIPVAAVTSCGAAAARRERVVARDIGADPLWTQHRELAAAHGLGACWSTPIVGGAGNLLGTFAVYYREPKDPAPEDIQMVDLLLPTAALAIERCRADEQRQLLLDAERRARRDAEAANRSKDEFVATLSHELRTPLNAILGWTRMLRSGELAPAAQQRALDSIERNTRAQSQLVEDLLDISRIITGKLRLDVRSVELSGVLDAAVDAIRPAADAKNIRLQKVLDPRAAPISGDPDRLQQVVWNLLSNAIKFTPKGGRVQVRLERVNSHVEIIVSDTGAGIPPDLMPRIFERFEQGESSSSKITGLGLGLAIARHLVELHGGTIQAASEGPQQGSTFTVKLPLMVARADRPDTEVHPTAGIEAAAALVSGLASLKVLVVEDDEDGREIVASILTRAGAEVQTASSAADGFSLALEWQPHVVISDIEMPGEDGYAFIGRLRRERGCTARELPAIALTAYARVEDRIKALSAGFQMHVPKPVEPAELVTVVKAVAAPLMPSA